MNKVSFAGSSAVVIILTAIISCSCNKSDFEFKKTDQGFELIDNGKPVFFYQSQPKSLTGEYICNNYIHPLYNLSGEEMTEEFPSDHPYHRGIFWTWHQIYIDTTSIGDGWINDGISQDVVNLLTENINNEASISTEVLWKSAALPEGKPFMNEKTSIIVYPVDSDIRRIDFSVTLNALAEGLELGGSADAKGYGGFCVRFKIPDNMIFTSEKGPVIPQELQIRSGPWMDFSGSFGKMTDISGLTILCHPDNPGYQGSWILRQKSSMQNAVFPGRERIKLVMNTPVTLKYRLIIHNGDSQSVNLKKLQEEYCKL